jgi:hypothetical protein
VHLEHVPAAHGARVAQLLGDQLLDVLLDGCRHMRCGVVPMHRTCKGIRPGVASHYKLLLLLLPRVHRPSQRCPVMLLDLLLLGLRCLLGRLWRRGIPQLAGITTLPVHGTLRG